MRKMGEHKNQREELFRVLRGREEGAYRTQVLGQRHRRDESGNRVGMKEMLFELDITEPKEQKAEVIVSEKSELSGAMKVVKALGCSARISVIFSMDDMIYEAESMPLMRRNWVLVEAWRVDNDGSADLSSLFRKGLVLGR